MWCQLIVGIPVLLIAIWVGYFSLPRKDPLKIDVTDEYDWDRFRTESTGPCAHPVVIRDVLKLNPEDAAKYPESEDPMRAKFMRDRLVKVFGTRKVSAFAMSNLSETKTHGVRHTEEVQEFFTIKDYMLNPEILDKGYVVNALSGLGSHDEYHEFMEYYRNIFADMQNLSYDYLGAQFFIGRGTHTGSHMHFAWGLNMFFMLSGQKHWIVVDPEFATMANCSMGHNGYYGHCWPNRYMGDDQNGQVNMTKYLAALKGAGLPDTAYYDFVLNPGDMLVNCDLWPHVIENLTPETTAISGRFYNEAIRITPAVLKFFSISLWNSWTELWKNPDAFTFWDLTKGLITGDASRTILFDSDPRLKGLGVLNQKNAKRNAETVMDTGTK